MTPTTPKPLITAEAIATRVAELGAEITRDYAGRNLVLVCSLKGATIFTADLARAIDLPLRLEFIRAESYGNATVSSGAVRINEVTDLALDGCDLLLVEDIVDTGRTSTKLLEVLRAHHPASLKLASLLYKPSRQMVSVPIDYLGFTIEDAFVVGYGMDHAGLYRNLPYLGILDPT
jgi:hypoxanthine phosphoribosyltransferase